MGAVTFESIGSLVRASNKPILLEHAKQSGRGGLELAEPAGRPYDHASVSMMKPRSSMRVVGSKTVLSMFAAKPSDWIMPSTRSASTLEDKNKNKKLGQKKNKIKNKKLWVRTQG